MQLHELLHPQLAHPDAACEQFLPDARPAIAASRLGVNGLDVNQQRIVAQMPSLGTPSFMFMRWKRELIELLLTWSSAAMRLLLWP